MSYNWSTSTYKIVGSIYKNKHEMIMIAKQFKTYVFQEYLGLSPEKKSLFLGKLPFSLKNNHVPKEKEFNFPQGVT